MPKGVKVIDVSVTAGIPKFLDVLEAVSSELVIESCILASEIEQVNSELLGKVRDVVGKIPEEKVPHEEFKKLTERAKCIIRTGETSSYANVILIGGVNF